MDPGLNSIKEVFQHQCGICFQEYNETNRYPMIVCRLQHCYCRVCCFQIIFRTNAITQCPQCRGVANRDAIVEFRSLNKIKVAIEEFSQSYEMQKINLKIEADNYKQQLKQISQKDSKKNEQIIQLKRQLNQTRQSMSFYKNKAEQYEQKIAQMKNKIVRLRQKSMQSPAQRGLQGKIIQLCKLKSWPEMLNKKELVLIGKGLERLPQSIDELINLQLIQLQMNKIYELPQSIVDLKKVKKLIINNNKLKSLPENINELNQLQQVNIAFNEISQLPANFCKLKKLQTFRAYENQIGKLPENFGFLLSLSHLYLYKNHISLFPPSFSSLSELSILYFDAIPNSPIISTFTFNNFKKLKYITIYCFPNQQNQEEISQFKVQCERKKIKLEFQELKKKF